MVRQMIAGALLVLTPIAAGQQAVQDQVLIRAADDASLQVVGNAAFEQFVFTQEARARRIPVFPAPSDKQAAKGSSQKSSVSMPPGLQFEMELVAAPEQPVDTAIEALRKLVQRQIPVEVASSHKAAPQRFFNWFGELTFKGVIASVSAKYLLFLEDGTPARATVNVSMKSADAPKSKDKD